MSKTKTQAVATSLNQAETIRQMAVHACLNSENICETAHWYFMQLANLFASIRALNPDKDSNAAMLAELGEFFSNDGAGLIDCSRDEIKKRLESIKTVPQTSEVQS